MLTDSVRQFISRSGLENKFHSHCRKLSISSFHIGAVKQAAFPIVTRELVSSIRAFDDVVCPSDPNRFFSRLARLSDTRAGGILSRFDGGNLSRLIILTVTAFLVSTGAARAIEKFERAEIRLEQNLLDKDVEVKFDVISKSLGLKTLVVAAPDGRIVVSFKSANSKFGMRHLELETPEPTNDGRIQADFPEGTYRFAATNTNGERVRGTAQLSHAMPPAPQMISPRPEQKDVPITGTKVQWKPMPGIAQYVLILEHEASGREITAILPGTVNVFSVPVGFLVSGAEYKVEIGTVAKNGNRTFVEYSISTANRP
jgi:hypothetical protein